MPGRALGGPAPSGGGTVRILWVTNVLLPEASRLLNRPSTPYAGWLDSAATQLSAQEGVQLGIASPMRGSREVECVSTEACAYYGFPQSRLTTSRSLKESLGKVLDAFEPDLVHLRGTEARHALPTVAECSRRNIPTVVEIQGLVSVIAGHMRAALPNNVVQRATLRNLIMRDSVQGLSKRFAKMGAAEVEAIRMSNYIVGRTTWDRACTAQISPGAEYRHCGEFMRNGFYVGEWSLANVERHSLFLSQGHYPVKGLHLAIEALAILSRSWPDATLYVAGRPNLSGRGLSERTLATGYGNYVRRLIDSHGLQSRVVFTGPLDEGAMRERYLRTHAFVSASSIENSPNSLAEAMLLGLPCVASAVGGVMDMLLHDYEGYTYQWDAPYMLAYHLDRLFADDGLAAELGRNAAQRARVSHDRAANLQQLLSIYREMKGDESGS